MRMKLIASLLVLCLTFSIGSALAQTDNNTNVTNPGGPIYINGNVTGIVNLAGQDYNYTGPVLIIRDTSLGDTNRPKEHIILLKPIGGDLQASPTILNNERLTPLQVNTTSVTAQQTGALKLILANDFKCQMTAKTAATSSPVNLNLSGDMVTLLGPVNDVNKLFTPVSNPKISMTENTSVIL